MEANYTPLEEIDAIVDSCKNSYLKRQKELVKSRDPLKKDLELRLKALKSLYYGIKDREEDIIQALLKDFRRSRQETVIMELIVLYNHILHAIEQLPNWIKPEKIGEGSELFRFSKVSVERISLGAVLVISPFNYPVLLSLDPIAGAIAGGNSVVWKPSELVPATSTLLEQILKDSLSPDWISVVQGAIPETTKLIKNAKFDKIFYTGSTAVGSIVAQEAGKNLVPYTLELGGKSPVFITEHFSKSKIRAALSRVFFGAFSNSGQTCVASDYVLIHSSQVKLVKELTQEVLDEFWPRLDEETDYTGMIHERAYNNTVKKLENTNGTKISPSNVGSLPERCLPPTVVFDVDWNDALMKEENFAPVLPFVTYTNLDSAISKVVELHNYPLALYIFSDNKREIDQIMFQIKSGGCLIGDTIVHVAAIDAPFGGIRSSGSGNYHGKWSFSTFTHERTVVRQPFWSELINKVRNPPYTTTKPRIAQAAIEMKPNFNRDGSSVWNFKTVLGRSTLGVLLAVGAKALYDAYA